jgi:NAD(P)-dependent dehydrogenase (short-subunit alcohol dehydrogenase family)
MHEMIRSKIDFDKAIKGKYLENYNITKYCGVLYATHLSKMLKNTKVVSLHPGVIKTELLDKAGNTIVLQVVQKLIFWLFRPMTLTLEEGA